MIQLTRLNGSPLAVNCDLIKYVEAAPALIARSAYDADQVVRNHDHNASHD